MNKGLLFASTLMGMYSCYQKKIECCGIIGILSSKRDNIADSLSTGVQLLKNRGYDSAGVVTFEMEENGEVKPTLIKFAEESSKSLNCIDRLVNEVTERVLRSHIGIGHTRWATCG